MACSLAKGGRKNDAEGNAEKTALYTKKYYTQLLKSAIDLYPTFNSKISTVIALYSLVNSNRKISPDRRRLLLLLPPRFA